MLMGLSLFFGLTSLAAESSGEGAIEVIHEPKVCIMDPCPQLKIVGINGDAQTKGLGGDVLNIDTKKMQAGKSIMIIGTWTREGDYFKIKVKEWMLNVHEKIDPAKQNDASKEDLKNE